MIVRLESETCYRAIRSRDPRFDGRFFVGVSSTGIYCRPVCTVKMPRRENCTFFSSAAAAESRGYRPCLRCRPELAPGNASIDARHRIAQAAASLIEDGNLSESGIDGIADRLGVTARHLRRVFRSEFGVAPIAFAQTQRLLMAKRLLTDTALPITEVAYAAGFGSLSRFEALFKERYRLSPNQLRRTPTPSALSDSLIFELSFRPPYDWGSLIGFLGARSVRAVEEVEALSYRRIVRIVQNDRVHTGWVEVTLPQRKPVVRVVASASLAKVLPALLEAKKRGVIIDIGHGAGSFNFDIAEAAIQQGLTFDTISSDVHVVAAKRFARALHRGSDVGHRAPRVLLMLAAGAGVAQPHEREASEGGGRDVGVRVLGAVAPAAVVVLGGDEPVQRAAHVGLARRGGGGSVSGEKSAEGGAEDDAVHGTSKGSCLQRATAPKDLCLERPGSNPYGQVRVAAASIRARSDPAHRTVTAP